MRMSTAVRKLMKMVRSVVSMALMAIMIGVSNVIMEEDRSVNDTRARIEQQVIENDEEEG
ncbi:hypothetical protein FGF1_27360 [Flavobacteriaceae bacterium GF1]